MKKGAAIYIGINKIGNIVLHCFFYRSARKRLHVEPLGASSSPPPPVSVLFVQFEQPLKKVPYRHTNDEALSRVSGNFQKGN